MQIAPYIVSRSYTDINGISYSFICDMRYRLYYILKGSVSLLWEQILLTSSYESVESFAIKNNQKDELETFLSELKRKKIIFIDKNFSFSNYKYLVNFVYEKDSESFLSLYTYFSKIIKNNNLLNSVMLSLGYKCNLTCKHCFNPKDGQDEELSFELAKKFIDEAYDLGITNVTITGGECTFNKSFLDIVRYIRKKHLFLSFFTNAQLLYDDEFFEEIVNLYPYKLRISLYSMNPEVHDKMTNSKGSHYKTVKVIQKLRERNIEVIINCPVLTINKNDYLDVIKFASDLGIKAFYSPYFINNPMNKNSYLKLSKQELEDFYFEEIKSGRDEREEFRKDNKCLCDERMNYLCFNHNADFTLCNDFNYPLGNLNTTSLEKVWKEEIPQFYKKLIRKNIKGCFENEYCKYCTYCPKFAMFDAEFMEKSPSCCEQAIAYYNAMNKFNEINLTK